MSQHALTLELSHFASLGEFAKAGLRSTTLALERAQRSFGEGRIPIAGAAVSMDAGGQLTTVTVGNNGRIPPPGTDSIGYPTDHGETAAIRELADVGAWDWSRVVFTTTLSPCIMCNRTLSYLYTLGLNKIVIAEAQTYPGTKDLLKKLPGMTLVELTNPEGVRMMRAFSRTYPWDWAADIGEVPPQDLAFARGLSHNAEVQKQLISDVVKEHLRGNSDYSAGVVSPKGKLITSAGDQRSDHGGNPTYSAAMIAMGEAGSSVNLRECVLVFAAGDTRTLAGVAEFGHSSLGACELFRPAAVLSNVAFDDALKEALGKVRVEVIETR